MSTVSDLIKRPQCGYEEAVFEFDCRTPRRGDPMHALRIPRIALALLRTRSLPLS